MKRPRCISFDAQQRMGKEVFLTVGQGKPLSLSQESHDHVRECPLGETELESFIASEHARIEIGLVQALINRYEAGERDMLVRKFPSGIALYDPDTTRKAGLFAFLKDGNKLVARARVSEEEFNAWDPSVLAG